MPPPEPSQPLVVWTANSQIIGDITWAVADMLLHTRRSLFACVTVPVDLLDEQASYGCDHEVGGHKGAGLVSVSLPYCCMFE